MKLEMDFSVLSKEKLPTPYWLTDQIAYKPYGLTEEEIKIIEARG